MKRQTAIIIIAIVSFVLSACSKPSHVVKDFYNALKEGDYEKAVTYTDIEKANYKNSIALMQLLHIQISDYEIVSVEQTSDTTATVVAKVSWEGDVEDTSPIDNEVKLVKINGKWKIDW